MVGAGVHCGKIIRDDHAAIRGFIERLEEKARLAFAGAEVVEGAAGHGSENNKIRDRLSSGKFG